MEQNNEKIIMHYSAYQLYLFLRLAGKQQKTESATTQAAATEEKSEVTLTNGKEAVTVKTNPKKIVVFDLGVADTIRELGFCR